MVLAEGSEMREGVRTSVPGGDNLFLSFSDASSEGEREAIIGNPLAEEIGFRMPGDPL
jgi:hypothetical protein